MTIGFLPLLQKASQTQYGYSGTVINISSISGIVQSAQHHFGYNASKAAAIQLTKMLASEVAENGLKVRINSIAPGVFPSEMTAGGKSGEDQKSHLEKEKYEKVPARRPGKDEDMANAVLFAATNQYLNGQTVAVDGGYILHAAVAKYRKLSGGKPVDRNNGLRLAFSNAALPTDHVQAPRVSFKKSATR
ncbi:hypothetical protein SS1G_09929 [Sclerotinia sclerotiorum 1980 UF-70]|uniref:Uncharacterized protein n=1 Tax=Sclerotinia sclerotiorum (strain ATCC 18683 / 1980 / Ss-1) TaxID=665079 RepID=A7EX69_SCLS1|nr:hypothetical protein SS1G_09929 [Sclerotinia sclerotiorum 1980 UF-70]EDN94061.1 hypothetical protein SS1G_09929 [Sclerotinia sclerotiorum 1980 UF-70]